MHVLLALLLFQFSAAYARKPIQLDLHARASTEGTGARGRGLSRRALVQNVTFSQQLEGIPDTVFLATVGIGTPPQLINVTIDLISSDVIIPDNTFCENCGFVPAKSPQGVNSSSGLTNVFHRDNGQPNAIPITGSIWIDSFAMGDIQVPVTQFLVAADIDGGIAAGYEHGFLGLGGSALSTVDSEPIWQTLLGSNNLPLEFGLWLSRNGTGPAGSFFLGGYDTSVYSGAIDFLPVTGQANTFWGLNVTGLSAQGTALSIPAGGQLAQFDVNSASVLGPQAIVDAFWGKVPGATPNGGGSWIFPCGTDVQFNITFGGRSWTIPSGDMALEDLGGGDCFGTLIGFNSTTSNQWVIGFQFLKNVYTAYQTSPPMVGIADLSTLAGGSGEPNSTAKITSSAGTSSAAITAAPTNPFSSSQTPAPTNPLSSSQTPAPKQAVPVAAIAGGVVGALALVLAVLLALFCLRRRRRSQQRENLEADMGVTTLPHENTTVSPFSSPVAAFPATSLSGKRPVYTTAPSTSTADIMYAGENVVLGADGSSDHPTASGSGSQSHRSPSSARSRDENVALRNEVQHLREEVQHWQAVAETAPPPSYAG